MDIALCTLFEGHYHYGVGALVNSLYENGFRGVIWVGTHGSLPPWAKPLKVGQGYQEFSVAEGCFIRFITLTTPKFISNCVPDFMLDLLENYCPDVQSLFYFDCDVFIKCNWEFYQDWVSRGITLCEDAIPNVPANHPWRLGWKEFAEINGYVCKREINRYYNNGCFGIKKDQQSILLIWKELMEKYESLTGINLTTPYLKPIDKKYPHKSHWYLSHDQDFLNLALMLTSDPLSTIGPEGMDFNNKEGRVMTHAAGWNMPKPWKKQMIFTALDGSPPSLGDKAFWKYTQTPIQLFSQPFFFWKRLDLAIGKAIGRFIHRSY